MSPAADIADARGRAVLILKLIEGAIANRTAPTAEARAAALMEENVMLKARAEELEQHVAG